MDKPVQKLDDFCLNQSEARRLPFEMFYPLCSVEYNCTASQGKYLYNI